MAGRIRKLLDELLVVRGASGAGLSHFVRAHLVLSGIDPDRYDATSPDDERVERKLREMIQTFKKK